MSNSYMKWIHTNLAIRYFILSNRKNVMQKPDLEPAKQLDVVKVNF